MTKRLTTHDILAQARPVIPVLAVQHLDDAIPLAEALRDGGLTVLEVTLRTPAALDVIKAMKTVPGILVGAGTVTKPRQLLPVAEHGADFVVSPGISDSLLLAAREFSLPFLPGVTTASELMQAIDMGHRCCKFFPAEVAGGTAMLKSLSGPFPDITFCPTGGIGPHNVAEYLALPNVQCVGGSWIVPPELLEKRDWAGITALAKKASRMD